MGVALGSAILGVLLGAVSFRIKVLDYLLAPLITLIKNAPVACVIVLLLVSLGSQGATAAIVVFVALPPFFVAIQEALNNPMKHIKYSNRVASHPRLSSWLSPGPRVFHTSEQQVRRPSVCRGEQASQESC